jgi:predicted methyltransferase
MNIEELKNTVIMGDCISVMKNIPDGSVDMILCDLPL